MDWLFEVSGALGEASDLGFPDNVPNEGLTLDAGGVEGPWTEPLATMGQVDDAPDVYLTYSRQTPYNDSHEWDQYNTSGIPEYDSHLYRPAEWSDCDDYEIDYKARVAAFLIKALPDSARTEYGYLIWEDSSGNYHLSNLIVGDNNALTGLNPTTTPSSLGFTSWDQVVGIIHSHPTERLLPDGTWITVPASANHHLPGIDDWAWPDFFAQQGTNDSMIRQYILHGSKLAEFELYNNQTGTRQQLAENNYGACGA